MSATASVSLSDLSASVLLSHADAVTIARETGVRAGRGELSGIPAPDEFRLRSDGQIEVDGPAAAGNEIRRAARLLAALLAHAKPDVADPAAFRIVLARAFADDETGYESLDHFMTALAPFAAPNPDAVLRRVAASWGSTSAIVDPLDEFESEAILVARATLPASAERQPLRTPPADGVTVGAAPDPWPGEAAPLHEERRRRWSRWHTAAANAAVLAALLPALWFYWRWRSAPAEDQPTVAHRTEAAIPSRASEPAKVDVPTPVEPDTAPSSRPPAPSSAPPASVATTGAAPTPATAGKAAPTELIRDAAFSPAFASKESGLFYHSGSGPGSAIMRADTDDAGMVLRVTSVVNDRGSNFHPRPSPDGQMLAFDSDRDGERGVYVADTNGRDVRRVSGPGFAAVPSWSPDGGRLAFVRAEDERPHVWNIWIVDVATGDPQRITSHGVGQPWGAAWFPDGDRIAYSHENRLIVRTLDGKDVRVFESPIRQRLVRTPAVSPDGKRIIFQVRREGAWMLELSTGSMHRVLEDPTAEEFTWSPDGRRVAYHSRRSGAWGVWVMSPR